MASTPSENRKRNEKKSTEKEEAHFVSRVTVILTREKERDYLLNLHMSQSTCFGTWIETGVDFYGLCVLVRWDSEQRQKNPLPIHTFLFVLIVSRFEIHCEFDRHFDFD